MQNVLKCDIIQLDFCRRSVMTIEGYFDGTAVKPLEPVDLKPQQKVYIHIPNSDLSDAKNTRIQKKLDAIHSVFGMLSEEEMKSVEDSISKGIKLKEFEI